MPELALLSVRQSIELVPPEPADPPAYLPFLPVEECVGLPPNQAVSEYGLLTRNLRTLSVRSGNRSLSICSGSVRSEL